MTITFPSNTRETINAIREAIGRDITVSITASVSGCSVCSLDPINNTSTNPFCPTCSGHYWFITASDVSILGHARWFPFDEPHHQTGGIVFEGDCIVTIEHTNQVLDYVQRANYFLVDGKRMVLWKYVLRGKPDINRIRLMLKEEEQ